MAMKKASSGFGETVFLGNDAKRGQVKKFSGFYVGNARTVIKEGKRGAKSVYHFADFIREDSADAQPVSILCFGQLFGILLDPAERERKNEAGEKAPAPSLIGCYVEIEYLGKKDVEGFKVPLHQCEVAYDDARKVKKFPLTPLA